MSPFNFDTAQTTSCLSFRVTTYLSCTFPRYS